MAEDKPTDCETSQTCKYAKAAADAAADSAVKKTFAIMGVDVDDPEKVEDFRMDLRFGRSMRKAANRGMLAAVAVITSGILMLMWNGLKISIK